MDDNLSWRELPGIRSVGRYAFFALCSFGVGIVSFGVCRGLGLPRDISSGVDTIVMIWVFLTLRDMSIAWNWALKVQAAAIKRDRP